MTTSEIYPALSLYTPPLDAESAQPKQARAGSDVAFAMQSEYLDRFGKNPGKVLSNKQKLIDTIPELYELFGASKQDFAGKDPAGRETMKTIAGITAKGISMSAIAAGTVAAIAGAGAVLVAPAAAIALPVIAAIGAATMYVGPGYAESAAHKAVDIIGDGAQAAGKWFRDKV